ncbi:MAG: hypothetical protein ABI726_09695, partial [bacterium]
MIAALILVGCGGSSDSGSPDDALDTICKDSQAGVRQLGAELGQATRSQDQAALADVFEQLSDLLSSLAADLRGLAPPP